MSAALALLVVLCLIPLVLVWSWLSWQRRSFNVKDYGAVGDGVTDDTAAIRAAVTAAHRAGGGIVYIPAGTYIVEHVDLDP